jgi:hypothetical protein
MSTKRYMLLPRMLLGILLLTGIMPKAIAKEVKAKNEAPICPIEQVINKDDLKSSNQQQVNQKSEPSSQDRKPSTEDEESCQKSETSEADETSDEPVGVPETSESLNTSDENLDQFATPVAPVSGELSNPGELNPSQPSISNQDSHDTTLNFHVEFGSPPLGGGESFPLSDSPAPTEPEPTEPEPVVPPSEDGSFNRPTQLSPARSKSQDKQNRRLKNNKEKHQKSKKLRKTNKDSKQKGQKRSRKTSDKALRRKMHRGDKSPRKIKSHTRQSPLKRKGTSLIRDKSHRDKLPLIHRKHRVQKLRVKGHRREFNPIRHPLLGKPSRRTHFRHSSPKRFPNTFRSRSQFRPRFRPQVRRTVPRLHRVHRRR